MGFVFFVITFLCLGEITFIATQSSYSCDHPVYCNEELLSTVQLAKLFNDSKTFVDLKQKNDSATTLANFEVLMDTTYQQPSKDQISQFVNDNFEHGDELIDWTPIDLHSHPPFINKIENITIRNFAQTVLSVWESLGRKINPEIAQNSDQYSIIPVPNGFIVPGGRFKEYYYWDSYWIIKGLLVSGMDETARGMLENFMVLVEEYGFIPNGGRVYYLNRSQPPLLTLMVDLYYQHTYDATFLEQHIDTIDKELHFWLSNRTVQIEKNNTNYTLARYDVESPYPRPESYAQDVAACSSLRSADAIKQCYIDLKSGAESGWDFSSRWLTNQSNGNLSTIQTSQIIPVDLNSFLAKAFLLNYMFHVALHHDDEAFIWLDIHKLFDESIEEILYNSEDRMWYDYDLKTSQQRKNFYPSNLAPLWAEMYDVRKGVEVGDAVTLYLKKSGVLYDGGIPTSVSETGLQWDFPNAWPPLQALVIMGLKRTGSSSALALATDLAEKWLDANIIGFSETGHMFEKYDARHPGQYGGGGEYQVQDGFGWTNGVALELIYEFYTSWDNRYSNLHTSRNHLK